MKKAQFGATFTASIGPAAQQGAGSGDTSTGPSETSEGASDAGQLQEGHQPVGNGAAMCDGTALDPEPRDLRCGAAVEEEDTSEEDPISGASDAPWRGLLKERQEATLEQRIELLVPPHAEAWVVARVMGSGDPQALLVRLAAEVRAAWQTAGDAPIHPSAQCAWQPDSGPDRTEASDED